MHLKVDRAGKTQEVTLTLEEAPSSNKTASNGQNGSNENSPMRGVEVQDLTPDIAQQLGLKPGTKGVVVTGVPQDSAAAESGLQRGDVIEQVNRQNVNSTSDYERLVNQAGNQSVVLLVNRGGNTMFLVVQPQ